MLRGPRGGGQYHSVLLCSMKYRIQGKRTVGFQRMQQCQVFSITHCRANHEPIIDAECLHHPHPNEASQQVGDDRGSQEGNVHTNEFGSTVRDRHGVVR
jgi:hypothetical protein